MPETLWLGFPKGRRTEKLCRADKPHGQPAGKRCRRCQESTKQHEHLYFVPLAVQHHSKPSRSCGLASEGESEFPSRATCPTKKPKPGTPPTGPERDQHWVLTQKGAKIQLFFPVSIELLKETKPPTNIHSCKAWTTFLLILRASWTDSGFSRLPNS